MLVSGLGLSLILDLNIRRIIYVEAVFFWMFLGRASLRFVGFLFMWHIRDNYVFDAGEVGEVLKRIEIEMK